MQDNSKTWMRERDSRMLLVLDLAIKTVCERGYVAQGARQEIGVELRRTHAASVRIHAFSEAWATHELMRMLDDSPTVNAVRRELQARIAITPHSNRGVGYLSAKSFSGANDDES